MGLYFTPEARGLGMGKNLLQTMKNEAEKNGLSELQLHATITAKSFYESHGFKQSAGDTSIQMRGVEIPCFPMSYFF